MLRIHSPTLDLAERMMRMVGFRNIAIHDYRRLNLEVVKSIVTTRLDNFLDLTRAVLSTPPPTT